MVTKKIIKIINISLGLFIMYLLLLKTFTFADMQSEKPKGVQMILDKYEQLINQQGKILNNESKGIKFSMMGNADQELLVQSNNEMTFEETVVKIFAENTNRKNLLERFSTQIENMQSLQIAKTVVDSLSSSGTKRVLVKTIFSKQELQEVFDYFDKSVVINELFGSYYELEIENNSLIDRYFLENFSEGNLPEEILTIQVVEPILVNVSGDSILEGEQLDKLRGITKLGANYYQNGLMQKNSITLGIIDTGIDYNHQDLSTNIWHNNKETLNGIDDDGNGYVDDIRGFDFVNNDNDPMDDHSHGTHVAGTAGGVINGGGIFGVNGNAKLVPLKVLSASGYGTSYNIAKAIKYAADNGINVINLSLGGSGDPSNSIMCDAIDYAKSLGTISVVAAGNNNMDVNGYVPAGCINAITVSAVDSGLNKASFSNYGDRVDVAGPGVGIYSTIPGNKYSTWNGTSMASPHIAGLVSAMISHNNGLTYNNILDLITNNENSLSVGSSQPIGRFVSMEKVFASMGILKDGEVVENLLPIVTISSNNISDNNYNIQASWEDKDGYIIENNVYINGVLFTGYSMSLSGLSFDINITENTEIIIQVTDNEFATSQAILKLDYKLPPPILDENKLPIVDLNYEVVKNNYKVNAIATDEDGRVVKYEWYVNGEKIEHKGKTYRINKRIGGKIKVVVTDNEGGEGEKEIELEVIPNQLPIVDLNYEVVKNNYKVNATATDEDGRVVKYEWYVNGEKIEHKGKTYRINKRIGGKIKLVVIDNEGGEGEKEIELEVIPNQLPIVDLNYEIVKNNYKVNATATDEDGRVVKYEWYVNGEKIEHKGKTYRINKRIGGKIKLVVIDNEGGEGEKEIELEVIPNQLPIVSYKKDNFKSYDLITINATDEDGKVAKYEWYFNGVKQINNGKSIKIGKNNVSEIKVIVIDNEGGQNSLTF